MNANWMPGVAALMGFALVVPATATAQYRDPYGRGARARDERFGYAARIASERGYEDGLKRGRRDGDHRDRYDPTRDGKYRDGDRGYKRSYGPRYEYVRAYRRAFEQGYRDGFDPYYANGRGSRDRYGSRDGGNYGRDGSYSRDGGYYGRDGRSYAQYPFDAYDYQRDGRHRHEGRSGWCTIDHRYDDRGRIYEIPR
jgi:hypothetical protein